MLANSMAPVLICWTSLTISTINSKYSPAVISPALYSRNFTVIEELSFKNSFGKSFIPRYLNLPTNLKNWFPLPNIQFRARSLVVSDLRSEGFPVQVRLLAMCKGELSAMITRLMSKCLWSRWKWQWGVNEMLSSSPCSPVVRECSWKKTHIEKKYIYIQCKSNSSNKPQDLSNVQVTEIKDIREHCIPLDVPYLTSPWWWVPWTIFLFYFYLAAPRVTLGY